MSDERREGDEAKPQGQGPAQGQGQGKRRFGKSRHSGQGRQDGQGRQEGQGRRGDPARGTGAVQPAQGSSNQGQSGGRGKQRQKTAALSRAAGSNADQAHGAAARQVTPQRLHYQVPKLPKPEPLPEYICVLCQKPIFDLSGALSDRESGLPVHFDCALERVTVAENLEPGEKVAYLGAGNFGVVAPVGERADGAFTVKRRIAWEKEGEKKDWRKQISAGIASLTKA